MPRGGNNRLPRSIKKQRGTLLKGRDNFRAPKLSESPNGKPTHEVPPPPKWMNPIQKQVWKELKFAVEWNNVYTPAHAATFQLMVETVAITRIPDLPSTALVRAVSSAAGLLARFGLDPSSNDRVTVVSDAPQEKKTEDFLFGPPKLVSNGE